MARNCTICQHPRRKEIDVALMLHQQSYDRIAGYFGLMKSSLQRHELVHLRGSYRLSQELKMKLSADNLLDKLNKWESRMDDQYAKADAENDYGATVSITRAASELIGRMDHIGIERDQEQRIARLEEQIQEDSDDGNPPDRTAFESA